MKKLLLLAALLTGCTPGNRYVHLAADAQEKTVMVEVKTVVKQVVFAFEDNKFTMTATTVPVTVRGAGVFVTATGHILTCAHLFSVGPTDGVSVILSNGEKVPAELLYAHTSKDLALMKIDLDFPHPFASLTSAPLQVGQEVLAIGNPHGLTFTVSHGIISTLNRTFDDLEYTYTQEDTPINPGNSGGPLFNLSGELIGINSLKVEGDGLAFAIAPRTIDGFLNLFRGIN